MFRSPIHGTEWYCVQAGAARCDDKTPLTQAVVRRLPEIVLSEIAPVDHSLEIDIHDGVRGFWGRLVAGFVDFVEGALLSDTCICVDEIDPSRGLQGSLEACGEEYFVTLTWWKVVPQA